MISITLDSLLAQSYPAGQFEILVVDNNSTDDTAIVVGRYCATYPDRVKYFKETRQGSHFARNNVVKHAKGELLYFTDDDMIADSNMLSELVNTFEAQPEVGTASGRVIPHWEAEPPQWLKKYFVNGWLSLYDNASDGFVSDEDFGVFSCHQMVRKSVFSDAGGYNPDIIGKEWVGDNETGLNIKIKALGYKFAFCGKSVTQHIIPPRRMTQQYFNRRFANQGNCDCYTDYKRERYSAEELRRLNISFAGKELTKFFKYLAQYCSGKDKWHVSRAYVDYYKSRIKYNRRLISDPEWRDLALKDNWID